MGTPSNLSLGPGRLYAAPLGTPILTALIGQSEEPPSPWAAIGYTVEGSSFSYEFSSEDVEVAESLDPLSTRTTSRTGSVTFSMAENTVRNLARAMNGGTVTTANGIYTYEPPEPGTEIRRMLVFISEDGTELWTFRQCYQTGTVTMDRRKGADKTAIPVEFSLEKPASGGTPFRALYSARRAGGADAYVPGAPTSPFVIAVSASGTSATVSRVSGGTAPEQVSYAVYGTADGTGTVLATALPFTHSGRTVGQSYTYTARATSEGGSTLSNSAAVTIGSGPSAPLVISATAADSAVTIARVSGGEATEAVTFAVYRSADTTGTPVATALPFTDTGRTNETTYTYTVKATNSVGSTISNTVTAKPFAPIPSVSLQAVGGDGVVNITSSAPGAATMVLSEGPTANGPWTVVNTVSAASMTHQRTGRSNTVQYFYKVDASNSGASRTSSVASATPIGTVVPITTLSSRNTLKAFSSPYPIARYREPGRTKVVIRNLGVPYDAAVPDSGKAIQVLYVTTPNTNGNQPAETGWTTVPVGSEFVDTSGNVNKLFVRVDPANVNAGSQLVEVYSEVTVQ